MNPAILRTFFNLLESIAMALGQTTRLDEALQTIDSFTGCLAQKLSAPKKCSSNIRLSAFFNSATKTAIHAKSKPFRFDLYKAKSRKRHSAGSTTPYACVISAHCSMSDFLHHLYRHRTFHNFRICMDILESHVRIMKPLLVTLLDLVGHSAKLSSETIHDLDHL